MKSEHWKVENRNSASNKLASDNWGCRDQQSILFDGILDQCPWFKPEVMTMDLVFQSDRDHF